MTIVLQTPAGGIVDQVFLMLIFLPETELQLASFATGNPDVAQS